MARYTKDLDEKIKKVELMYIPLDNMGLSDEPNIMKPVCIRPINEIYEGKTYLGFYLGDFINSISLVNGSMLIPYGDTTKEELEEKLVVMGHNNPAIFVPEFSKVIWGGESWWGFIKDEKDMHKITDEDINNIWYVRVLKMMSEAKKVEDEKV